MGKRGKIFFGFFARIIDGCHLDRKNECQNLRNQHLIPYTQNFHIWIIITFGLYIGDINQLSTFTHTLGTSLKTNNMDTKPLEVQAENYIKSQLVKFEFKVTKPSFDKKGADLIIIDNIDNGKTRFLLVQSKGRSVKETSTSLKIPMSYIEDNFILFLYTVDYEKNDLLFLFFAEDIRDWHNNNDEYVLNFNHRKIKANYFSEKIFNRKLSEKIQLLLSKTEIKNYTSLIIDGIFLEKSIDKTIQTYSDIWPKKKFIKPDLNSVIENILDSYDKFKTKKKIVNCYLLLSESFDFEHRININQGNNSFITNNGNQVKVFINKTNEIISFEVLEQLNRLINNDNIILVADDQIYQPELETYKNNGKEIIVVMFNEHNGSNMLVKFNWGDIMYPLGISLGLERFEL